MQGWGGVGHVGVGYVGVGWAGCQLKTFKTFILMVEPLKPLFFSENPFKTFILDNKPLFSGKAVFHMKLIVKV